MTANSAFPTLWFFPRGCTRTRIDETAPPLCIEIGFPGRSATRTDQSAEDYLGIGAPQTSIFDPETKKPYIFSSDGLEERNGIMRCGQIALDPAALFAAAAED